MTARAGAVDELHAEVRVVLDAAAELVERVGLWQGGGYWPGSWVYCDGDPVCTVGALYVAAGLGGPDFATDEVGNVVGCTARSVMTAVDAWSAVQRHLGTDAVHVWSDTPGRTATEVAAVLRATAEQLGGAR